jgi:murein DD-endopeptidase MepM/ murein hydrolase activator NlpD
LKAKKTFSDWLTNKYLLVVRNEENFAEKTTFGFNYAKVIVFTTTIVIILFSLSFYLSNTILSKWFHPAGREMEINKKIISLSATVDSLEAQITYRDKALTSISQVMQGNDAFLGADVARKNIPEKAAKSQGTVDTDEVAPIDDELRKEFEGEHSGENENNLPVRTVASYSSSGLQNVFLFAPLSEAIVSQKYSSKSSHYGIDLVSKKDEPVKCVADGTVILSSWTNDSGHVIAVQHQHNLISVYKHNSVLLKKAGSFVRAGEVISVIGNSGELTTGPHLHFELWHNSNPIDPQSFISF